MEVNILKSSILFNEMKEETQRKSLETFPFNAVSFEEGVKYLGFDLKPNDYKNKECLWLPKNI